MGNQLNFFTESVHRLVSGSLTDKVTKDRNNNNAPIPEDKQRYEFGIAMLKTDPDTIRIINEIHGFLAAEWANDAGKIAALNAYWQNGCDGVSLKIKDGDKPNSKGKVNEHTKGCFVFYFSNWGGEAPRTVDPHNQDIPGEAVKRGFYVQVAGTIKDNGEQYSTNPRQNRCGAYLDSQVVRLVAEGDVIVGGVDPETAFGGTTAANASLPEGARPLGTGAGIPGMGSSPNAALPGMGNAQAGAQVQQQAGNAALPGANTAQQTAPQTTASHGDPNATANIQPHNGILGGPGATTTQQVNTGLPGLPGN